LLLGDLDHDDARAADVREIANAAKSAASLTRQLLAFSRQQVLQPSPLELNDVVADVARMLERTIGAHIELRTSLAPGLGAVLADRGQIEQVLMNLAVNARDAMPKGGKLTLETRNVDLSEAVDARSSFLPGPHALLSVTDSGTGMDEATKARIFDPFFTTKELGRGTGLGLATVYGIVQQSGGHISVYTEIGKGTSFKIYLPRVGRIAKRASAESARPAVDASGTLLLVEDDESLRRVTSRVLRSCGYEVLEACQPSEALSISAAHPGSIDAMVTDVVMPGMTGPELAAALSQTRPEMRVLFTSGYSAVGIVHGGSLPPGASFIEKPFAADSLRSKVREVLAGRRSE
jgi:CheY-like chemotaxis protein